MASKEIARAGRRAMLKAVAMGFILAFLPVAFGQAGGLKPATVPLTQGDSVKAFAYEVVTIKPAGGDPRSGGYRDLSDGFSMKNLTLQPLIPNAYGVIRNDQVTNWPKWAAFERFDIEAKMDVETADTLQKLPRQQRELQRQLMMQSLLTDRFKLKVHRGIEVRTSYELALAKGGSRLKEDDPAIAQTDGVKASEGVRPLTDWNIADGSITGHAMPMSILVNQLQGAVDAIVVDKTGMTRRYDVVLRWDPKADQGGGDSTAPSIFTALKEQLGLQLKQTKTTVETIVIDHLEMPSAN